MPMPTPEPDEERDEFMEVPLHPGGCALIDACDADAILCRKWFKARRRGRYYAVANIDGKVRYMHRVLMPDAPRLDHANGDGLDNRRSNLRWATPAQNGANRAGNGGSSAFKGVCWHKGGRKWMAQVGDRYLGLFNSEVDAAHAYDAAALALYGPYAVLNFPEV